MTQKASQYRILSSIVRRGLAILCAVLLTPGEWGLRAEPAPMAAPAPQEDAPKIPNDELDSLVAPIALYPDPLLAQVLAASTYPLELIQLQQWLAQHKDLKDKALADAVAKQDWDPSVQGLAALPDVVKRLADDIKWTTDLGNAFLAQQSDVMGAVQRMRAKAEAQGNLKSSEQVKVETKVVESQQVIVIEQANPQVIYVPTYNPVVVYGPPVYPYPPIYYPPPSYYAAGMAVAFGVGVAMGAMWSGGWGYNCGWRGGNNTVIINNNNNFNRNTNINGGNRNTNINGGNRGSQQPSRGGSGGNNWQHNPQHRGGTPYSNKATANQYGGTTRGSSQAARQDSARQQQARQQGGGAGGRQSGAGVSQGQVGGGQGGGANRGGAGGRQPGAGASQGQVGGGQGSARPGQGQAGGGQAGNRGGTGGADRVGNRSVSTSASGGAARGSGAGAFGGSGGAASGAGARASSSRGASSAGGGTRSGGGGARRK